LSAINNLFLTMSSNFVTRFKSSATYPSFFKQQTNYQGGNTMRARAQILLLVVATLCLASASLLAQAVGDFGSKATGNWGTDGSNWIVCTSAGTWAGATDPAPNAPTSADNVWILNGHTVTVEASPKTCNNLTVESGATLVGADNLPTSSLRYVRAYGTTITNNGTIGTAKDVLGFGMYGGASQALTITGSGTTYISRLQPQTSGQSVTFDANVQFDYAGSSGTGSTALYTNNADFSVTINAGKTVTMSRYSYTSAHSSSGTSAGNANFTINIYGTFVTGNLAHINLNNTAGKTSALTVYNGGSLVLGDSANFRANVAGPVYNIAFNDGGSVTAGSNSMYNLASATTTIDGTLDFGGSITSTRDLGTATVGATGRIRLADGVVPSGTATLVPGSTIEYYGTSAISVPASPPTYQNLQINNSAGVTLEGNVTATTLTLTNGNVTTGANTLSIASGGSVARTSGYVIGTLQKHVQAGSSIGVTYELGTANGYSPVDILFANVTTAGDLGGSIVPGDHPNIATSGIDAAKDVNEYWSFGGPVVFDTYNATFNFAAADVDVGANTANFVARAYNGDAWSPLTVGTKTATSTQISGAYSGGGVFALGEAVGTAITITADAGPNGSISPSGTVNLAYAQTQAFTITPSAGYHVDSLLVDEVKVDSTTSYTFINPVADHTIRAVFGHNDFQITASAGTNGTITPSGTVDVSTGANLTFHIAGTGGYIVDSVIVDDVKVDSTNTYTFVNITANHTIRATFIPGQYTIAATSGANGSITPSGLVPVNYRADQAFTIAADANYHIDSVIVDGAKVDSTTSYTFVNVIADHAIRAVFAINRFTIAASASPGGTITPSGATSVAYGGDQAYTISPNVHYLIDSVIVDGAKVDSTTSYTFVNVTAAHTIRIVFTPIIMGIRSNGTGGGAWGDVSTWQGGFVPILSDTVSILAADSVLVNGNQSCKVLNVLAGGRLFLLPVDTLTVTSSDTASAVNGTVINEGLVTVSGRLRFGSGAVYQHTRNGGSIPLSVWDAGSMCEILGLTGNAPSNGNQDFYNMTWNCPSQSSNLNMGWNGNTIGGDITVVNTGGSRWQMCAPSSGNSSTVTINGDIIQTGGTFTSNGTSNGNTAITINSMGNINVTGGNFSVSRGSQGGTGTVTWNVYGNFSISNTRTLNSNSGPSGSAKFVFAKSGVQTLVLGAGNTLDALPIEVKAGSTLNIDTCVLAGNDIFALDSGATIVTARAEGLDGNLTNTGEITLSPYANFAYDGSAAQVTGALLPADINSLTINNAAGVTLSDTVALADSLYLTAGKLTLSGNLLTVKGVAGSSTAKYVVTDAVGALKIGSVGAAEVRFPVGTASAYAPLWITNAGTADAFNVAAVSDTAAAKYGGRVKAKWNIAEGTAGGSNCTLKFGWMGSLEDAAFAADRATNAKIFAFGTDTAEAGTGAYTSQFTSEPYTIARAGIASLGTFAVGKFSPIVSVDETDQVPHVFMLSQNYPNPFNPTTTIEFTVPKTGLAKLTIYNLLGQKIATLFDGDARTGVVQRVVFNASRLASGVYFARLEFGDQRMMRRLMVLK
jgi:hypothetical protein